MEPVILDGKALSLKLNDLLKVKIDDALTKYPRPPGLATVLVGEDKASQVYVGMKVRTCEKVGIKSFKKVFA